MQGFVTEVHGKIHSPCTSPAAWWPSLDSKSFMGRPDESVSLNFSDYLSCPSVFGNL